MTTTLRCRRVLVVGAGAREHALGARLAASEGVDEVIVAPGNAGTGRELRNAPLENPSSPRELVALARHEAPDLVVIGPEAPLVAGGADALREADFLVFGPGADGARLEASKDFGKQFATRYGIPTTRGEAFDDPGAAHEYLRRMGGRHVVKADGLCSGKGVVVAASEDEAHDAIEDMLVRKRFGDASRRVVIEELVTGEEISVHVVLDGTRYVVLPAVQDHKRIGEGDTGENTGGMGAYGPAPAARPEVLEKVVERIVRPSVTGLHREGIRFRGVLFLGLMVSDEGEPVLLEYNVRFGDPETAVLMALLDTNVATLLAGAAAGRIPDGPPFAEARGAAAAVVLASAGYPAAPRTGDVIEGLERALDEHVYVLHAGTRDDAGRVVTAGGRVLAVTATGEGLREALDHAYAACDRISFAGKQLRRDIGHRALR